MCALLQLCRISRWRSGYQIHLAEPAGEQLGFSKPPNLSQVEGPSSATDNRRVLCLLAHGLFRRMDFKEFPSNMDTFLSNASLQLSRFLYFGVPVFGKLDCAQHFEKLGPNPVRSQKPREDGELGNTEDYFLALARRSCRQFAARCGSGVAEPKVRRFSVAGVSLGVQKRCLPPS